MSTRRKIFGIGLPKTGTLSLHTALRNLGINSVHYPINDVIPGLQSCDYQTLEKYGAFVNCGEWHFAALDKHFPDSLFVYTWREFDDWIVSVEKHFKRYDIPERHSLSYLNRLEVFSTVVFDREIMQTVYYAHRESVERYFHSRSNLLKLNVAESDAYAQLCRYLGFPVENIAFPHENRAMPQAR